MVPPLPAVPRTTALFAFRHGQSEANFKGLIVSDRTIGSTSFDLSDVGKVQAQESASHFIAHLRNIFPTDVDEVRIFIHSSPFLRARSTAKIVLETLIGELDGSRFHVHPEIAIHQDLSERYFGEWDLGSDAHYKDVWSEDESRPAPSELARWWAGENTSNTSAEQGTAAVHDTDQVRESRNSKNVEDVTHVLHRSLGVVREIIEQSHQNPSPTSQSVHVLVAHGDVLQILLTGFQGLDPARHRTIEHLPTAGWRRVSTSKQQ